MSEKLQSEAERPTRGHNKKTKDGNEKPKDGTFIQRQPFQQIYPHVYIHFAYFSSNATNGR
jgi:hypothetical protein